MAIKKDKVWWANYREKNREKLREYKKEWDKANYKSKKVVQLIDVNPSGVISWTDAPLITGQRCIQAPCRSFDTKEYDYVHPDDGDVKIWLCEKHRKEKGFSN